MIHIVQDQNELLLRGAYLSPQVPLVLVHSANMEPTTVFPRVARCQRRGGEAVTSYAGELGPQHPLVVHS